MMMGFDFSGCAMTLSDFDLQRRMYALIVRFEGTFLLLVMKNSGNP
jgi:hypothetical protein